MKRAVVILGAGASFDVANSSVPTQDHLRPPLARHLFEPRFAGTRSNYAGAVVIGSELGELAQRGDAFDLEAHLTRYAKSPNDTTRFHFRQVPGYLRDVLMQCGNGYVPTPANYNRLVQRMLEPMDHEFLIISLNYDQLFERALATYDASYRFDKLGDYTAYAQVKLIKVHGSTNWFVAMPGSERLAWIEAAADYEPNFRDIGRLVIRNSNALTFDILVPADPFRENAVYRAYPWLTSPIRGKTLSCPEEHVKVMRSFLEDCHKFLIIGTSGLDDDLLLAMSESINSLEEHLVHYVDYGGTPARERFERAIPGFVQIGDEGTVRTSIKGFSEFLNTDELETFLEAD